MVSIRVEVDQTGSLEERRAVKKTPLKRRGKRLFPQSPEDKAYWEWFKKQRYPCDVCGQRLADAAHLTPRSSGGKDRNNTVYLCRNRMEANSAHKGCHERQEKRTDAFILECNKPLWDIAKRHTRRFDREGEA